MMEALIQTVYSVTEEERHNGFFFTETQLFVITLNWIHCLDTRTNILYIDVKTVTKTYTSFGPLKPLQYFKLTHNDHRNGISRCGNIAILFTFQIKSCKNVNEGNMLAYDISSLLFR